MDIKMIDNKVTNGKFEFDFTKYGFKYASRTEMYIAYHIKDFKKRLGWSLEKCIEHFNEIENWKLHTTKERIIMFYSDEFKF